MMLDLQQRVLVSPEHIKFILNTIVGVIVIHSPIWIWWLICCEKTLFQNMILSDFIQKLHIRSCLLGSLGGSAKLLWNQGRNLHQLLTSFLRLFTHHTSLVMVHPFAQEIFSM